jgi:hypothetical protein
MNFILERTKLNEHEGTDELLDWFLEILYLDHCAKQYVFPILGASAQKELLAVLFRNYKLCQVKPAIGMTNESTQNRMNDFDFNSNFYFFSRKM